MQDCIGVTYTATQSTLELSAKVQDCIGVTYTDTGTSRLNQQVKSAIYTAQSRSCQRSIIHFSEKCKLH